MIRSKCTKEHIIVECNGKPERLMMELLSIVNSVIQAIAHTDCFPLKEHIISGQDGRLYDAETIDIIGGLLVDAITEKTSPVWEGVFN